MYQILIFLLAFVFVACNVNKPGENKKQPVQEMNGINGSAEFAFNEEIHNFGQLQSGEVVVFTFVFTNTGKEKLKVTNVETDCGCVSAHFTNETAPGETGIVEIEFDSSGLFGKQFKTIVVHANTKKPKQLAIFAEVQNEEIEITY